MVEFGKDANKNDLYINACENLPKIAAYTEAQVSKYIVPIDEYLDWVWNNKISIYCPAPYHFYIQMGSYIESELRCEVYGAYREVATCEGREDEWSCFSPMTRWDWRGLDNKHEDSDGKDYWVINLQELELNEVGGEDALEVIEDSDYIECECDDC